MRIWMPDSLIPRDRSFFQSFLDPGMIDGQLFDQVLADQIDAGIADRSCVIGGCLPPKPWRKWLPFHANHLISLGFGINGFVGKLGSQAALSLRPISEAVRNCFVMVSTASSAAISPERCPPMPSHTTANVTRVVFDELTWQVVMLITILIDLPGHARVGSSSLEQVFCVCAKHLQPL